MIDAVAAAQHQQQSSTNMDHVALFQHAKTHRQSKAAEDNEAVDESGVQQHPQ